MSKATARKVFQDIADLTDQVANVPTDNAQGQLVLLAGVHRDGEARMLSATGTKAKKKSKSWYQGGEENNFRGQLGREQGRTGMGLRDIFADLPGYEDRQTPEAFNKLLLLCLSNGGRDVPKDTAQAILKAMRAFPDKPTKPLLTPAP